MRKSRSTEEQMVTILREADRSTVAEAAKKHKVSEPTIYAWCKHFGQMEAPDVKRLKTLEQENTRLKKLLAERCSHPNPGRSIGTIGSKKLSRSRARGGRHPVEPTVGCASANRGNGASCTAGKDPHRRRSKVGALALMVITPATRPVHRLPWPWRPTAR